MKNKSTLNGNSILDFVRRECSYYEQNIKPYSDALHRLANIYQEEIRRFIDAGEDINITGDFGETSLHIAAGANNIPLMMALIYYRANLNAQESSGCTPLHYAARKAHSGAIEYLVMRGAQINIGERGGDTPLHILVQFDETNTIEIIKFLIAYGADVNSKTTYAGFTILHTAAESGNVLATQLLIEAGANPKAQDMYGRIPYDGAHPKVKKMLGEISGLTPVLTPLSPCSDLQRPTPSCDRPSLFEHLYKVYYKIPRTDVILHVPDYVVGAILNETIRMEEPKETDKGRSI